MEFSFSSCLAPHAVLVLACAIIVIIGTVHEYVAIVRF